MNRINQITAILGRRGTGKTTYAKALLNHYSINNPGKKILIVDTLDHPDYRSIGRISKEHLKDFKEPGVYRVYDSDTDFVISEIEANFKNGLLLFEDASKFISKTISKETRRFLLDSKQKNVDSVFLFHGFSFAPPELFRMLDLLVLFKCDSPETRKNEIVNYEEIKKCYDEVMRAKNPYENRFIKIY